MTVFGLEMGQYWNFNFGDTTQTTLWFLPVLALKDWYMSLWYIYFNV